MEYFVHSIYDFCGLFFLILLLYREIRVMTCYFAKGNKINLISASKLDSRVTNEYLVNFLFLYDSFVA